MTGPCLLCDGAGRVAGFRCRLCARKRRPAARVVSWLLLAVFAVLALAGTGVLPALWP